MAQGGSSTAWHVPVLAAEVARRVALPADGFAVDATTGGGGHSLLMLEQLGAGGHLLCLDQDGEALAEAEPRLRPTAEARGVTLHMVRGNFREIARFVRAEGRGPADAVLADIGVSSHQLDEAERGFSYQQDGPLDMRMDTNRTRTAADLVNELNEDELAAILRDYGEERHSGRIARAIVRRRAQRPFTRTGDLADVITAAQPAASRRAKQHPAKRSFQALRIAVNEELAVLDAFLEQAPRVIKRGGRLLVITFHSLEDRRVKQAMRQWEDPCTCPPQLPCVCGKKPWGHAAPRNGETATAQELRENPRARSARLRTFIFDGEGHRSVEAEEADAADAQ